MILAALAAMTVSVWAQKPLELSAVIKQENMDANALYEATRNWFVESFNDSKAVIQNENPGKQITGKGTMPFTANMMYSSINGFIEFLIDVQFRDGRLKLTMRNFNHRADHQAAFDNNMGILVDELPKNLGDLGLSGQQKTCYKYYHKNGKPACEGTFQKIVADLTKYVNEKKVEAEEDW
jgi:hypothetical protein